MALSEIINKIRTAVYGREIRNSIADGLEEINKIAENSNSLSEMAMQTAYGVAVVDYSSFSTTNEYNAITPMLVSGTKFFSIFSGKLLVEESGKYFYIIEARVVQDSKVVRRPNPTTETTLLTSAAVPYSTAYMLSDFGIVELNKEDYFILQSKATNGKSGFVNDLKLALIRIGNA